MLRVAIIGAGFCGTLAAVQLLHRLGARRQPSEIALCERTPSFTGGVAYGTRSEAHSLNVPAGRMSALPEPTTS